MKRQITSAFLLVFSFFLGATVHAWEDPLNTVPILIAPQGDYAKHEFPAHHDMLEFWKPETGVLEIYDGDVESTIKTFPDWRALVLTDYNAVVQERDRAGDWGEQVSLTCLRRATELYLSEHGISYGTVLDKSCMARAALDALGGGQLKLAPYTSPNDGFVSLTSLLERLPLEHLTFYPYGSSARALSDIIGVPHNVRVVYPAAYDMGRNVVRLEILPDFTKDEIEDLKQRAYRHVGGMWCPPNKPCQCQYNIQCTMFYAGLLAAWTDKTAIVHWLIFIQTFQTIGEGTYDYPADIRLYHIIREPGKEPYIDEQLDEKITAFIENQ